MSIVEHLTCNGQTGLQGTLSPLTHFKVIVSNKTNLLYIQHCLSSNLFTVVYQFKPEETETQSHVTKPIHVHGRF